jgi:transposase InsO family protein
MVQEVLGRKRPVGEIAAKYGVSRTVVHRWLKRSWAEGVAGMGDRSRRPLCSPRRTPASVEEVVCALRGKRETWGPEKLHRCLQRKGVEGLCSGRTVGRILQRCGKVAPREGPPAAECHCFERPGPNELWQLDFKGHLHLPVYPPLRVLPMSIEDDHSRFALTLRANGDCQLPTVWGVLWEVFGEYGLPQAILTDNDTVFRGHTGAVTTWTARLWRLGIAHLSGRPYPPQTQGKVERLHGTLQQDVLKRQRFHSLEELQAALDAFRETYNHERPHAALELDVPAEHYRPSPRPAQLPPVEYPEGAVLRKVWRNGAIKVRGCRLHVGEGLAGEQVQLEDRGEGLRLQHAGHSVREVLWDQLRRDQWV